MSHEHDPQPHDGDEQTEPRNNLIVLYGALSAVAVVILCIALTLLFMHTAMRDLHRKVEQAPNEDIQSLHAKEDGFLHNYAYDAQQKVARIPIEEAIALEAKQPWHPQVTPTPVAGAAAPAATPAQAPASETGATTATTSPAATPAATTEPVHAPSH